MHLFEEDHGAEGFRMQVCSLEISTLRLVRTTHERVRPKNLKVSSVERTYG